MKLPTISAVYTVFVGAELALGKAVQSPTDVQSSNSTDEVRELINRLVWLKNDELSTYLGNKAPGDEFLGLCAGDHSGDIVSVDRIDLTHNPPVKGQDLIADADITIKDTVGAGARVAVKVKLGISTVYETNLDLCKEIEKVGVMRSISSANPKISKTCNVPKGLPRGTYTALVNVVAADGSPSTCLEGKFKL